MRSTICSTINKYGQRASVFAVPVIATGALIVLAAMTRTGPAGPGTAATLDPDTVLLRYDERTDAIRRLAGGQKALEARPRDPAVAAELAHDALRQYSLSGDGRFLGYAETAIEPWRGDAAPPLPIWLLRGRLLQTRHLFARAGEDLDRLLARHGDSVEATLLAADAWRRAGRIERAKSHCAGLALLGRSDLARYCAADVLLTLGRVADARQAIAGDRTGPGAQADVYRWTAAVAADVLAAAGEDRQAEAFFRRALAAPDGGLVLHLAYADFLIASHRPREALALLEGLADSDAVLLRRAIAVRGLEPERFERLRAELSRRFAEAARFGSGGLHTREHAMFALQVEDDFATALRLARRNWNLQKGWEDGELLRRAAAAAEQPDVARSVVAWRERNGSGRSGRDRKSDERA